MQTSRKKARANGGPRLLTLVHRYLGLGSAAVVLLLSVTGLLLNHTDDLQMDSTFIQNDALLSWYGIGKPEQISSFAVSNALVSAVDARVFLNTEPLEVISAPIVGALAYHDTFLIASRDSLFVYSQQWQLVEKLDDAAGLPLNLVAIGTAHNGQLVLQTPDGYLLGDEDLLQWRTAKSPAAIWSRRIETPNEIERALLIAYRGTGLSLERVMLDLHSGRLFGKQGVLLVDAAAVLFVILACSGIWLWARRRKR